MTLKSVTAAPSRTYAKIAQDWQTPPTDGIALDQAYAWEEARLAAMKAGDCTPLAYVWVPERAISLSRREAARLDLAKFTAEPIAIRGTGGTAVPQGPGTANITLFTRHTQQPDISAFYERMCDALQFGFRTLGLDTSIGARAGSFCDGAYNILHNGQKLAGTAQRWCRAKNGDTLGCHHIVILTGSDPAALCARVEALYRVAGEPETYDPAAHCAQPIEINKLRAAMHAPLDDLLQR